MVWKSCKKDRKMKNKFSDIIVYKEDSILSVLKNMDSSGRKLMIVLDENKFLSLISIGDIQRAIIKNIDLNTPIYNILRHEISYAKSHDDISSIKEKMKIRRNELMPIVSEDGTLEDIIFWEDLFQKEGCFKNKTNLGLPVIIMAGGLGTRLKPLTNIFPKPLLPINEKTIVENIMDRFVNYGCHNFYISINYKADLIKYYLQSLDNKDYHSIEFFQEKKPLGTAGSLHLLKNKINSTFFVTNCDIIVEQDYEEILKYHMENKNEITIVAALNNYYIPYGTLTTKENGILESIHEKPEYTFKINTGFYILEPHLINEIPIDEFYHITKLIEKLQKESRIIGVFPVTEKSWIDIGNWQDYNSLFLKG